MFGQIALFGGAGDSTDSRLPLAGSVPLSFIDYVHERLVAGESFEILDQDFGMAFRHTHRGSCDVRGDEDVRHLPEGVVSGEWFDLADIEGGTREVAGLQGGGQVGEVDDDAATDVDEVAAGTHAGEGIGSEEFFGEWGVRGSDDDEVALCQERGEMIERLDFADVLDGARGGVDAEDMHPEGAGAAADFLSDGSDSDDAKSAIGKVQMGSIDGADLAWPDSKIGVGWAPADGNPPTGALLVAVQVQVPGEGQHVAQHVIGDHIRKDSPHVCQLAGMLDQGGEQGVFQAGRGGLHPAELSRS